MQSQLGCSGYVVRLNNERQKFSHGQLQAGMCNVGRLLLRYKYILKDNLRHIGIEPSKFGEYAVDQSMWRKTCQSIIQSDIHTKIELIHNLRQIWMNIFSVQHFVYERCNVICKSRANKWGIKQNAEFMCGMMFCFFDVVYGKIVHMIIHFEYFKLIY